MNMRVTRAITPWRASSRERAPPTRPRKKQRKKDRSDVPERSLATNPVPLAGFEHYSELRSFRITSHVVAGLVPAAPSVGALSKYNRGGRDKPGHDARGMAELRCFNMLRTALVKRRGRRGEALWLWSGGRCPRAGFYRPAVDARHWARAVLFVRIIFQPSASRLAIFCPLRAVIPHATL